MPASRESFQTLRRVYTVLAALGRRMLSVPRDLQAETWQLLTGHHLERSQASGTDDPNHLCGPFDPEFMGFCMIHRSPICSSTFC